MDPMTMGLIGTVITAGTTMIGASAQADAMEREAADRQRRAAIEAQNAEVRAKEETAQGQQKAGARMREARLAQSRLKAVAGASGSSSSDPSIMGLWRGIEEEGQYNADREYAAASSVAQGIKYQSDLDVWSADANARVASIGARGVRIGGVGQAIGGAFSSMSSMRGKYGGYSGGTKRAYG